MHLLMMLQEKPAQQLTPEQVTQITAGFHWIGFVLMATLGIVAVGGALQLLAMVIAPDMTSRSSGALRRHNFVSFAVGAAIGLAMIAAGAVCKAIPILALPWIAIASTLGGVGLTAASEDLGRRLFWTCGREGNRATHILSGWSVMALASCLPVLGWFVIAPYLVFSGIGSVAVGLFTGRGEPSGRPPRPDVELEIR